MDETRVICIVENGCLIAVYSNNKNVVVDLLDYDNMAACASEDKDYIVEYDYYQSLDQEIKDKNLHKVW